MKKHIVCLGDSNTHGYCADPADCADGALQRFNEEERWTCLLQKKLGEDYLVAEEGLSGRTTVFDDPLYEHLSALDYLYPCLKSHEPVSLLIVMLGTNDTKQRLGANAYAIGLGLRRSGPEGPDGRLLGSRRHAQYPGYRPAAHRPPGGALPRRPGDGRGARWKSPNGCRDSSVRWQARPDAIFWTPPRWAARTIKLTSCI